MNLNNKPEISRMSTMEAANDTRISSWL